MHLLLLTACWLLLACVCNTEPLLTASTEVPTKGEVLVAPSVVKAILAQEDNNEVLLLDECVRELGLKKNEYHELFRSVRVKKMPDGKALLFVRPALEPYCGVFYGVHLFRYWLVTVQKEAGKQIVNVLFANGGDGFEIFPEETMGYNDIASTGCTARGCATVQWKFDGEKYLAFKYIQKEFSRDVDDISTRELPCLRKVPAMGKISGPQ